MPSSVAAHRPRSLLAIVVVLLAAIPPILVFSDRWFGSEWLANMWRDEWCRTRFLCDLSWPPYIVVILGCAVGVLALIKYIGTAQIAPQLEVDPSEPSQPVSEAQRRLAVMLIVASVIGVVIEIARLAVAPTVPGWDYILICALYVSGWFLMTTSLPQIGRFLRGHWLVILAYALGLAAVSWLLFSLYARNQVTLFSVLLLILAALVLFRARQKIDPGYWLVLLALVVFSLFLNAWNFITIGDEYSFYETAVDVGLHKSLLEIGERLFDGTAVYGSHPYLSSVLLAPGVRIFDQANFGWRYGSIAASAFAILFFYYFFRTFLKQWVAFSAAFLMAASEYLMVISRIGYNNPHALLAMGVALATTTWAIKSGRRFAFVAAGIGLAFCFYVFPAGIYAVPIVLWLALLYRPPRNRAELVRWGIYLGTLLIFVLPLLFQPDYWESKIIGTVLARTDQVPDVAALGGRILTQFGYAFLSFLFVVNESHYVRVSYVDAITGGLVLIGLAVLVWRVRADKFALYVLTSLVAIVFMAGATHSAPAPPTTRMFLALPFFAVTAVFGLQWLVYQFGGLFRTPQLRRLALAGLLVVILGANLYQAYDTSERPPTGFLEIDALFVRLAQNLNTTAPGAAPAIAFVFDPARHYVPALQRQLDIDYLPVQVRGVDVTRRTPSVLERQMRSPDNVVALSPYLDSSQQRAFENYLRERQWRECAMLSTGGQKRIGIWYAPERADPCADPQSAKPVQLPDAGLLVLAGLLFAGGMAGMVLVERRTGKRLPLELPRGLPVGGSVRFEKGLPAEPRGPESPSPAVIVPPTPKATQTRGAMWELSIRLTFRPPPDAEPPAGEPERSLPPDSVSKGEGGE